MSIPFLRFSKHYIGSAYMRVPGIIHVEELTNPSMQVQAAIPKRDYPQIGGEYVPARPEPFYGKFARLRATWLVFTGKADALLWPKQ